jgi:3-hydroxyisobutyrate dehydrogenase-like beta-hydroxyacid dehydrogenase
MINATFLDRIIGLGAMGQRLARRILDNGFKLTIVGAAVGAPGAGAVIGGAVGDG